MSSSKNIFDIGLGFAMTMTFININIYKFFLSFFIYIENIINLKINNVSLNNLKMLIEINNN